jgi:hypothetical protein
MCSFYILRKIVSNVKWNLEWWWIFSATHTCALVCVCVCVWLRVKRRWGATLCRPERLLLILSQVLVFGSFFTAWFETNKCSRSLELRQALNWLCTTIFHLVYYSPFVQRNCRYNIPDLALQIMEGISLLCGPFISNLVSKYGITTV